MVADPISILISAGEPSGELHAARLVSALRSRINARYFGLGGEQMRAAGVEIIADCREIAVFGLIEAWIRIPTVLRILKKLKTEAEKRKPALAILTDSSAFHLPLAKKLKKHGVRQIYFISPQAWAWRQHRVRTIRRLFEKVLVIFPFEAEFYRQRGVSAEFIGNPLVDEVRVTKSRAEFCSAHGLDAQRPVLAVLPGSRQSELRFHIPVLAQALEKLSGEDGLQIVIAAAPGLTKDALASLLRAVPAAKSVSRETYNALAAADCAIVSSGTATVEAALLGAPMVVVYRLSRFTAALARLMVHTRTFAMVNLVAGRHIVPELIQDNFTPENTVLEVRRILQDDALRRGMKSALRETVSRLGKPGAIERAADSIAQLLRKGAQTEQASRGV